MLRRLRLILFAFAVALVLAPVALAQAEPPTEEPISDILMYSALVGFLLPPVLAILIQTSWSQQAKAVVAFIACVIAGAGTAYIEDDLTGRSWVSSALIVLTTGLATYRNFWKPTGIAPAIESKTNLSGNPDG